MKFRLNVDLKKEPRNMHSKSTVDFQRHKISSTLSKFVSNKQDNPTLETRQNQDKGIEKSQVFA